MKKTQLQKLVINKFRALTNVEINLGGRITVICGKNGTSKSSILGIAAQIFSFLRDYVKAQWLSHATIGGDPFKSWPKEHFRFSRKFDVPGSLDVDIALHDGYTNTDATAKLDLSKRTGKDPRPVVRNNSIAKGNKSRNFTHPVIYLSLARLQPIAQRKYTVANNAYLNANKKRFVALSNRLLNKQSSLATGTTGALTSAVAHSANYDQDSVSAGEDNAGQIVLALMSFQLLADMYPDYQGGLLLIDEADAGLFPAAQEQLLEILSEECKRLKLQVLMTSHSPTIVERIHEMSAGDPHQFKTIYLTDSHGPVQARSDVSWRDIHADLHAIIVGKERGVPLPKINVYFEDAEAASFFHALLAHQPIHRYLTKYDDLSLGCQQYKDLASRGIPEFSRNSVIVLDGDVTGVEKLPSIVKLPTSLPPDQLIFEFLYNLPATDAFWTNDLQFSRPAFTRIAGPIIQDLQVVEDQVDVGQSVREYRARGGETKARELFKSFYTHSTFVAVLKLPKKQHPWNRWMAAHPVKVDDFRRRLQVAVTLAMRKGFGVDTQALTAIGSRDEKEAVARIDGPSHRVGAQVATLVVTEPALSTQSGR